MRPSLLDDAFGHHVWATVRLIDACIDLSAEQLSTAVPGAYGSIIDTLRHVVGGDSFDLFVLSGEREPYIDEADMGLAELREVMERSRQAWLRLLANNPDPAAVVREVDPDDGYQRDAPLALRLAGALHHGSEHRSQVCTALTLLGLDPPSIDPFTYGLELGTVEEVYPSA